MQQKILIIGSNSGYAIEQAFARSFKVIGDEVETFDIKAATEKHVKLGFLGKKVNMFLGVDAWQRKANRELSIRALNFKPDIIISGGSNPVFFSTFAFLKTILHSTKIYLYWPDTLNNLTQNQLNSATLFDGVATYSSASIPVFKQMGFKNVFWMAFAAENIYLGDAKFHNNYTYDLSFIGMWRPEREAIISKILDNFPHFRLLVKGHYWKEQCKDKRILKVFQPNAAYGKDFANLLIQSKINLNVIDDTNYPAANMRFFETSAVGGLQLCSSCPEQENIFKDREHILYFSDEKSLIDQINYILNNPEKADAIRKKAYDLVQKEHKYTHRVMQFKNPNINF